MCAAVHVNYLDGRVAKILA